MTQPLSRRIRRRCDTVGWRSTVASTTEFTGTHTVSSAVRIRTRAGWAIAASTSATRIDSATDAGGAVAGNAIGVDRLIAAQTEPPAAARTLRRSARRPRSGGLFWWGGDEPVD